MSTEHPIGYERCERIRKVLMDATHAGFMPSMMRYVYSGMPMLIFSDLVLANIEVAYIGTDTSKITLECDFFDLDKLERLVDVLERKLEPVWAAREDERRQREKDACEIIDKLIEKEKGGSE